jgi:hypothetical protein
LEPDIDDLHNLIRDQAAAGGDPAATLSRFGDRASAEGRALELAISAIEVLRDRGAISGADVCRLAVLLGYENEAVSRAWNTRAEFDLGKQRYAYDAPIARVVRLP